MAAQVTQLSSCQCVVSVTSCGSANFTRDKHSQKTPQASALAKEVPQSSGRGLGEGQRRFLCEDAFKNETFYTRTASAWLF